MKSSRRSFLLNPLSTLLAGLLLGIAARLFDIYFQNLGEIFSQMAIWILLGTGIAIYSPIFNRYYRTLIQRIMMTKLAISIGAPVEHNGLIISWPYVNMKMRIRR